MDSLVPVGLGLLDSVEDVVVGDVGSVMMMLKELLVGFEVGVVGVEARVLDTKEIFTEIEVEKGLLLGAIMAEMKSMGNLEMILMIIMFKGKVLDLVELVGMA